MTKLDTIEFTTKTDFLQSMDSKKFTVSKIIKPNGLKFTNHSLNDRRPGVNKISVNENYGTIKINVSSKILKDNYIQGISSDTLDQLIFELNNTGIKLNKDFINYCIVKKTDVKNDLKLTNEVDVYLNTLNQLIAPKFTKTKYDTGIVFNEKIKTQPIRLTGYSKEYELKQNKTFYNELPHLINFFNDVLRIESRLPTKATVSKYFKSNNLIEILNTSCVNYNILDKIINQQTNFKPHINTHKMTNTEEKNFAQIFYLNDYYNGDFESIMKHIKSKLSDNTKASYQRKQVMKYLAMINNAKDQDTIQYINEIQNSLREV